MPDDSQDQYEYRGLIAQSWDLLRGDTSNWPDRRFYLDRISESGEPVLDVGCGTGRLLLDYLAAGLDVDGVDNSPEMLTICREQAATRRLEPTLYQQSMESLALPRRYRTIIVASSSFQLLIHPETAGEAMRRFYDHLELGGTLVVAFMVLWSGQAQTRAQTEKWHKIAERERPDGSLVRRWTKVRYDVKLQLEHTEDRYEVVADGKVVQREHYRRSPSTRWYTQQESLELFERAGYLDLRVYAQFTTEGAKPEDHIWTIIGRRQG